MYFDYFRIILIGVCFYFYEYIFFRFNNKNGMIFLIFKLYLIYINIVKLCL